MPYWLYILASRRNGTLYVGVTNDLVRRAFEHREGLADGFTKRYGIKQLMHLERFDDPRSAIQREKNLKHWSRGWKVALSSATIPAGVTSGRKSPPDSGLPGQARQ